MWVPSRVDILLFFADFGPQLNVEDLVDFITEPSVFMVVTDVFSQTTLHALHQEAPLSVEETGFVLGQTFAALEYLHDHSWTHGNLDPRSIQVMSRKHLWIKLKDIALSEIVHLGKPEGYHATYASQILRNFDQSPADIWSAGVVALELLLPNGLPDRGYSQAAKWVRKLERLAVDTDWRSGSDAMAFVRRVLQYEPDKRPKAAEVLRDPWIVQNKGELPAKNHFSQFPTQGSHPMIMGPYDTFSRQSSAAPSNPSIHGGNAPESPHPGAGPSLSFNTEYSNGLYNPTENEENAPGFNRTSVGPSRRCSRQSSVFSSTNAASALHHQTHEPKSRVQSRNLSRQSSIDSASRRMLDSHPYPGDEWNDFDSDHGSTNSESSRFTANPLAREPRVPTLDQSDN